MNVGEWGSIALTGQLQSEDGKRYVAAPAGARKVDRWRARAKYRGADGRLRDVERYAETKARAKRVLEKALREQVAPVNAGELGPGTTVKAAAAAWQRDIRAQGNRAPSTLDAYDGALARFVIGTDDHPGPLANLTLREVSVGRLDAALRAIVDAHGSGSAKMARTVYNGILSLAVRHGALATNPMRDVSPVRRHLARASERDTKRALTRSERDTLVEYARTDDFAQTHDLADLIAFLAGTGARIGEACALTWPSLDLDAGTARIEATLVRAVGQGVAIQQQTKTDAGVRTIGLPEWLVARLRARKASVGVNPWQVVFASPDGHLRDRRNTSRHLRAVFDAAGFPWATAHTLRKTVATLLDEDGLSAREIANQLGHARPSLTQDVYMDRRALSDRPAKVL
jgi:integrase